MHVCAHINHMILEFTSVRINNIQNTAAFLLNLLPIFILAVTSFSSYLFIY